MAKKKKEDEEVQDFATMFSWLLGMSLLGGAGATVLGLSLVPALGRHGRLPPALQALARNPRSLWLAAGAALAPALGSVAGLLLTYLGVPLLQPRGWVPPEKRSRSCAKVRFSAKAAEEKGPWDVIIVGSGMGGLTCGSVLSQLGYRVMVLEAHEVAGGSTHDYNVDGKTDYKFPSGLHYTIPASEEMLQVSCGAARPPVRFARMGDDTVLHDGAYDRVRLTRTQDAELRVISDVALKKDLRARFPTLVPQLERFERVCTELLQAFPIWAALHAFPWSVKRTLLSVLLPSAWWRYAGRTAEDVFGELFADAPESERENVIKMQAYLCGLFLDSGCAPDTVSFFMIAAVGLGFPHEGGAYPEHGTGEMAAALVQAIEDNGGSVFVRAPVARVLVDERSGRAVGVETTKDAGAATLMAKCCVVSACGWRNTARLCKGTAFPSPDELKLGQGDGFIMANIGIKGCAADLKLECTNMELLPAGQGLSIFEGVRRYMNDPLGVPAKEIPMMITFPSVKDRTHKSRPQKEEGRETAQLLCLARKEWFGPLEEPEVGTVATPAWREPARTPEYRELKRRWIERLRSALLSIYPQLEGRIELFDLSTPQTIEHYLPTGSGSAIGLDTAGGPGCRFTDYSVMRLLDMRTPVPGLWITGQDTLMCGVPIAQASGLLTAIRIVGPLRASWFMARSAWLLAASLGHKARSAKASSAPGGAAASAAA